MSNYGNMFATKTQSSVGQQTLNPQQHQPVQVVEQSHLKPEVQAMIEKINRLGDNQLSTVGSEVIQQSVDLSKQVLDRVKMKDTGAMGEGVNQILTLMSGVELDRLSAAEGKPGLFKKMTAMIAGAKLSVMEQFDTASDRITTICTNLKTGIERQKQDAAWLEAQYKSTLNMLRDYEVCVEAMGEKLKLEEAKLAQLSSDANVDPNVLSDQQIKVDRVSKQLDKLNSSMHLTKLTLPEIRSMQVSNYDNSESFQDLIVTVIPSWQKQMSLGILAVQQAKDAAIAKQIHDAANENIKRAASMVKQNLIATAQNSNRSTVDLTTLQHVQTEVLTAVQERKRIEQEGRQQRAQNIVALEQMDQQLKTEMSKW